MYCKTMAGSRNQAPSHAATSQLVPLCHLNFWGTRCHSSSFQSAGRIWVHGLVFLGGWVLRGSWCLLYIFCPLFFHWCLHSFIPSFIHSRGTGGLTPWQRARPYQVWAPLELFPTLNVYRVHDRVRIMSTITLSKQLVCGVSLAYTANVWLFSNELHDKLDAVSLYGMAGWGDASIPYGHGLIILHTSPEHLLCVTVRCQSFPFYLLSDFQKLV